MRFVIDMNLARTWVKTLEPLGITAVHWSDVGPARADDTAIYGWAREAGHHILTRDFDFAGLAVESGGVPSVVLMKASRAGTPEAAAFVTSALRASRAEIESGAIVSVDVDRRVVRSLPLRRMSKSQGDIDPWSN